MEDDPKKASTPLNYLLPPWQILFFLNFMVTNPFISCLEVDSRQNKEKFCGALSLRTDWYLCRHLPKCRNLFFNLRWLHRLSEYLSRHLLWGYWCNKCAYKWFHSTTKPLWYHHAKALSPIHSTGRFLLKRQPGFCPIAGFLWSAPFLGSSSSSSSLKSCVRACLNHCLTACAGFLIL